ncbi:related to epoxide hydrolase [Rhynchosporium agropyri]|uniref:Related to epoxide hydrolase n=1 Tax=Rhynchosporium agropyri TaxID=914238 RepID=A0A1E1L6B7_9HELO|nr:related to epoxide hydrolase [Rhynchosporium agropyri]
MESSIVSLHGAENEEIKPYKIHVSTKYLDLTKKKLELTRLPHEVLLPRDREWEDGTPKSEIEPLIDFWLEHYAWRQRETHLNTTLPQYRTAISLPSTNTPTPPLRIHFLYLKSPHIHALPLLLIPTFPLTNLSLIPLFEPLTNPTSPTSTQPFTLIIPSLPGLGFSDAFQTSHSLSPDTLLSNSAALCDGLMKRLGYTYYLASATGSGIDSPAGIDYHLLRVLSKHYSGSCLGIHVIEPCIQAPTLRREPVEWLKFVIARFFQANLWGYEKSDFAALKLTEQKLARLDCKGGFEENALISRGGHWPGYGAVGLLGLKEPNTFSYALCDSPVGFLSLVLSALRRRSPEHGLSKLEIIDVTQLAWLPGPEAGARFWASAMHEVERFEKAAESGQARKKIAKSRVAVTVFGADGNTEKYICPAWAGSRHDVLFSQRANGRAGIAVWERVDVLVNGIRGLAREVEKLDPRLRIAPLEGIVVFEEPILEEREGDRDSIDYSVDESEHGMQTEVESPDTIVAISPR